MSLKAKLMSFKDIKTINNLNFDEYIIVDCEYYSDKFKRRGINESYSIPFQVAALHYKNRKLTGQSLNQFIIYDHVPYAIVKTALSRHSSLAKDFSFEMSAHQSYLTIRSWFRSKSTNIPIIVVGNTNEILRLFEIINIEYSKKRQLSNKTKEFKVFEFSQLINAHLFNDKIMTQFGLDSFDDELQLIDSSLIRSKQKHDAYNDCVLTFHLYEYLTRNDFRYSKFLQLSQQFKYLTQRLHSDKELYTNLNILNQYQNIITSYYQELQKIKCLKF